jgi:hypothetical protein
LDHPVFGKKKVWGGLALPGANKQKPYAAKCGQRKTMTDLFRVFFTKAIPVKVSTLYIK